MSAAAVEKDLSVLYSSDKAYYTHTHFRDAVDNSYI